MSKVTRVGEVKETFYSNSPSGRYAAMAVVAVSGDEGRDYFIYLTAEQIDQLTQIRNGSPGSVMGRLGPQ